MLKPKVFRWAAVVVGVASAVGFAGAGSATAETAPQWYVNGALAGPSKAPLTIWGTLELSSQAEGKIYCTDIFLASFYNQEGVGSGAFEGLGSYNCKAPELEEALETAFKEVLEGRKVTVYATGELPREVTFREAEVCVEPNKRLSECTGAGERKTQEAVYRERRRTSSFPWQMALKRVATSTGSEIRDQIGIGPAGASCYPTETARNSEGKEVQVPVSWEKVPNGCLKLDVIAPQIPDELVFYGSVEPTVRNGLGSGLLPTRLEFGANSGMLVSSRLEAPETSVAGEFKLLGFEAQQLVIAR